MSNNTTTQKHNKEATATLRHLRITPRKVRAVTNMVKEMPVQEAQAQLNTSPRRPSRHILKLLKSAVANATHNHQMDESKLYIKNIKVDKGPTLKRWMPRAQGRVDQIEKRTSHISVTLVEKADLDQTNYIIPRKEKEEEKEPESKTPDRKQQDDQPHRPQQEAQKPEDKQPGFVKRIFRRKEV